MSGLRNETEPTTECPMCLGSGVAPVSPSFAEWSLAVSGTEPSPRACFPCAGEGLIQSSDLDLLAHTRRDASKMLWRRPS